MAELSAERRQAILDSAIARASRVGWQPVTRLGHRAELRTADRRQSLFIEVDPVGELYQQWRANETTADTASDPPPPPAGRRRPQPSWGLVIWATLVLVGAVIAGLRARSAAEETVAWLQALFFLGVGLLIYVALKFGSWKS